MILTVIQVTTNHDSFQATTNAAEVKKLQAGDLEFKEAKSVAAVRNRMEVDGLKTEEANAILQVCFHFLRACFSAVMVRPVTLETFIRPIDKRE